LERRASLLFLKKNPQKFHLGLSNVPESTTEILLDISSILTAAGLLIGVLTVSGLSFRMGLLVSLAGDSFILLLVFAAVAPYILGMVMPLVGAYALVPTSDYSFLSYTSHYKHKEEQCSTI